jgi:hypothetical protein
MLIDDMQELEFRSIFIAALHQLAGDSGDVRLNGAAIQFEEYLDSIQDDEGEISLLGTFQVLSEDEALRNYYATR